MRSVCTHDQGQNFPIQTSYSVDKNSPYCKSWKKANPTDLQFKGYSCCKLSLKWVLFDLTSFCNIWRIVPSSNTIYHSLQNVLIQLHFVKNSKTVPFSFKFDDAKLNIVWTWDFKVIIFCNLCNYTEIRPFTAPIISLSF